MKYVFFIVFLIRSWLFISLAQEVPPAIEQQLENIANTDQGSTEDDSYLQQLARFSHDPLNLNTADQSELNELRILTPIQVEGLISYRRLLGKLINIYELQAVPGWDIATIRRLLPFITVAASLSVKEDIRQRIRKGDHSVLIRISQMISKSNDAVEKYAGSPQRLFLRYRYNYKNLLQYGLTADKDAGEQFLGGAQKAGFDFYSFHVFVRDAGIIRALALGDFTVSMGQGLIQWQGLAFKKGGDVMNVKRQSSVLRPYTSAGEYDFHRGSGVTIRKGKEQITAFVSFRKLSTSQSADTLANTGSFSSFQTSGYHRTQNEIENRNNLDQMAAGVVTSYNGDRLHIAINGIMYQFSRPLQKRDEPYNLFAISGKNWYNTSVDYSYTWKNLHFFGEVAIDKFFHNAILNGLLISIGPNTDVSLVQRWISMQYQAVNGNAFTENSSPSNEKGLYAGLTIRPSAAWRWDAYMDMYRFPWLKYLVDAPSSGREFFIQFIYTPSRQAEIYARYKNESKQANGPDEAAIHIPVFFTRQNCRLQISYKLNPVVTVRSRTEMTWYDKKGNNPETGFLAYSDIICRPPLKPFSCLLRLQYFETGGYDTRLYAYENDVLYSYSIPVFAGKGYHYSVLLNYDLTRKISCWVHWTGTLYSNKVVTEAEANTKNEWKLQVRFLL